MEKARTAKKTRRAIVSAAACALLICSSAAAYAADAGGVQRALQLWIHGEQTEVSIQFDAAGGYVMEYNDENGNAVQSGGGGAAVGIGGSERPLTQEELLGSLNAPEVEYEDDGSVWIYYLDQKIDITDRFEDGVCYAELSSAEETLYMTIKYQSGWSTSPHKYPSPSSFKTER